VKTNDLIEALSARMGLSGLAETAGWVGMQARSTAPVAFDGATPVALALPMPQGDRNELVVHDGAGNVVQRRLLSATATELSWDGTGPNGAQVAPGTYGFTVESFRDGEYVTTSPVEAYDQVVEVRMGAEGPVAVLRGGSEIASADVSALRRP
jgi:flagellar basal-body rod modification protein FlgD